MSDLANSQGTRLPTKISDADATSEQGGVKATVLRPARTADVPRIHARLMEAIKTSPFYGDDFKAYEMQRLTEPYLAALVQANPDYILIPLHEGEMAGFMISGPEMGTLWLYWSYLFPELRQSRLAMTALRAFVAHWNNKRFHKIATYTRPDNKVARLLMERFGFRQVCLLENQLLGEDCLLYEHTLEKALPGYDQGVAVGRLGKMRYWLRSRLKI